MQHPAEKITQVRFDALTSAKKSYISVRIYACVILVLLLSGVCLGAGGNDSQTFKKGLDSFQKNKFPAAIKSFNQLLEDHPETPLRDMALYYLARAHLKSGNRQKAANFTNRLMREFPASYNKGTIDAELLSTLGNPPKDSETGSASPSLAPKTAKPPSSAPQPKPMSIPKNREALQTVKQSPTKLKTEKVQPKTEAVKKQPGEQSKRRIAEDVDAKQSGKTKVPGKGLGTQKNLPSEKAGEEKLTPSPDPSDPGRVAAVDYSKITGKGTSSIGLDISPDPVAARAGTRVSIPFTITNQGNTTESFNVESGFPSQFAAQFAAASNPGGVIERTAPVAPGTAFQGILMATVPGSSIDGFRYAFPIKITAQGRTKSFSTSKDVRLTASAPLLRAMVTTRNSRIIPGQLVAYTVTLLNAGSAPAGDISLRLYCPPSYQPVEFGAAEFYRSPEGLVLDRLQVGPGEIKELNALFKVSEKAADGEEIVCRADVIDNVLKTKSSFLSSRAIAEKQ